MLVDLTIRDLALLERAELAFGAGLNAVTGETGAGKSLLVGALEALLGETPRGGAAQWVRAGADEARVEGRFVVPAGAPAERVRALLARELPAVAEELEPEEDGSLELVLGRSLRRDGRTRAHVDHRPVRRRQLRAVAGLLLEIHGQNDHQRLLDPGEQLRLVDAFAGLGDELRAYRERRAAWLARRERLAALEAARDERRERIELLRFQAGELERAEVAPGERAALEDERGLLRHASGLRAELGGLAAALAEDDGALLDRLRAAERTLERWAERVAGLEGPLEDLRAATVHVEEGANALASFVDAAEDDPARLEAVEERLAELERLERKHGVPADALAARQSELARRLAELEGEEEGLGPLAEEVARDEAELARRAEDLTARRRRAGAELAGAVRGALSDLGLRGARLDVRLGPRAADGAPPDERLGPRGADALELLLAANPGEEARPLRHVASGGEAARILLALRTALREGARTDRGRTLVFDEVDAGVGGRLGPRVAAHLRALAADRDAQVLCVTHLPAIAAAAHVHLVAAKEVRRGRTTTRVAAIDGDAREREVAAMIAGGADEATARAEARRLLAEAG